MTLGTITLLAITGSMLAIKLAIMIFAGIPFGIALPGVSMPAAHD